MPQGMDAVAQSQTLPCSKQRWHLIQGLPQIAVEVPYYFLAQAGALEVVGAVAGAVTAIGAGVGVAPEADS